MTDIIKKTTGIVLAVCMAVTFTSGCGIGRSSEAPGSESSAAPETGGAPAGFATDAPIKLTFYAPNQATAVAKDYNEVAFLIEMEKRSGIHIEWIHPVDDNQEQFNLMIASGEYPDIMYAPWKTFYPGGSLQAAADGIIYPLDDLIAQHATNLKALYSAFPDVKPYMYESDGHTYGFPQSFPSTGRGLTSVGPQINKTYLDALGLEIPETIDEVEAVLAAFLTGDPDGNGVNDTIPILSAEFFAEDGYLMFLFCAYGVKPNFYQINGTAKYGPYEDGFKSALDILHKWYQNEWLDNECVTDNWDTMPAKHTGGNVGMAYYWGNYEQTTGCDWEPMQYPVLTKGTKPQMCRAMPPLGNNMYSISSTNKYPAESVKWMDYLYGDEGSMLASWGIEGESYVITGGQPRFTDLVWENPDGLSFSDVINKYTSLLHGFPFRSQFAAMSESRGEKGSRAYDIWNSIDDRTVICPSQLTIEEQSDFDTMNSNVNTYRIEMITKFMMGTEPLSNYDNFVKTLKDFGSDKLLEYWQTSCDRFFK